MAGTFRQAMVFLGLADEGYEQRPASAQRSENSAASRASASDSSRSAGRGLEASRRSSSRDEQAEAWEEDLDFAEADQSQGYEHRSSVTPLHRSAAPTESDDELRRITTIHPRSYNDAKVIGESFRESIPVIMNLTDMDVAEAKRLVDFSSGLTFALNGSIERVTEQVFLLTPATLEVLDSSDLDSEQEQDSANPFDQR